MSTSTPCARARHDALPLEGAGPADANTLAALVLDCLAQGLEVRFEVRGASMRPFIRDGDIVQAAPTRPADLRPGTIVLAFADNGSLIAHRITDLRKGPDGVACLLRGDAHVVHDGWFSPARIPGVVRRIQRGSRTFVTSNPPLRLAGRLWLAYAVIRAWTLRVSRRLHAHRSRTA